MEALAIVVARAETDVELRLKALRALSGEGVVDCLIKTLRDENNGKLREAAAVQLEKMAWKPTSTSLWVDFLAATNLRLVDAAPMDPALLAPLVTLLESSRFRLSSLRQKAVEALGRLGDSRAFDVLAKILLSDKEVANHEVFQARAAAAYSLAAINDNRAIPFLIQSLDDTHPIVAQASADALDQLNWKPVTTTDWLHYYIATGLKGGKSAFPARLRFDLLLQILQEKRSFDIRTMAAQQLEEFHDARAVEPILNLLLTLPRSQSTNCCEKVVSSLERILGFSVANVSLPTLTALATQPDLSVIEFEPDYSSGNVYETEQIFNLARVRELAQKELGRRKLS